MLFSSHNYLRVILICASTYTLPTALGAKNGNGNQNHSQQKEPVEKFDPLGPKVRCEYLPLDFLFCAELVDHKGNKTAQDLLGYGCVKVGGEDFLLTGVRRNFFKQLF